MGNLQLPGLDALSYNPPMWDNVIETPRLTVAIAFTPRGQKNMYYKGWCDAIDDLKGRFDNQWYNKGYLDGLRDLELLK